MPGVNLFDTADVYTNGQSEELLGEILKAHPPTGADRHQVPCPHGARGQRSRFASRKHIIEACEASLKRLGTDYIDLYQIHNQDLIVPPEETLRALDDLVRSRHGASISAPPTTPAGPRCAALATSDRMGTDPLCQPADPLFAA